MTLLLIAALLLGPLTERTHYSPGDTVKLLSSGPVTITSNLNDTQAAVGSFVASGFGGVQLTDQNGNTDVITVAENFFDTGVGGNWGSDQQTFFNGKPKWQGIPAKCRAAGVNCFELFFWAPCDFSLLSGTGSWFSGQARYQESDADTLGLIQACQAQGIAVVDYVNRWPAGPVGYALTQQHPEFFIKDSFGHVGGVAPDLTNYARWDDSTWTGATWTPFNLNLKRKEVVEYGLNQIKASVLRYGWAGVRYDGHYTVPGNPSLSSRNMAMVRRELADVCRVGFNFGKGGDLTSEGATGLADGGMYLQETGSSAAQRAQVAALGGSYYAIQSGATGADQFAHPWYANLNGITPQRSAFLRRWSAFLLGWNRSMTQVGGMNFVEINGARYYVTEYQTPGTYQLGRSTNVITPEKGLQENQTQAVISTVGLVVDTVAPTGAGTGGAAYRCVASRNWSGYPAAIGGDERQYRPDMSTGTYPILGVSNQGPFPAGTYSVTFSLWLEPGTSGQLQFEVDPVGGNALLKAYGHTPDITSPVNGNKSLTLGGWLYQNYTVGTVTVADGAILRAGCWPLAPSRGVAHLDSISFVKQ